MEERSLRVLPVETTFFNKISNTLSRLLIPTKISLNGVMINLKRNRSIEEFFGI